MRLLLLVVLLVPALAFARPQVAVAPLDGDKEDKVADAVAAVAKQSAKVSRPEATNLTTSSAKKLRGKLDVDVVVFGEVTGRGKDKKLTLTLVGRSSTSKLVIEYGTTKQLRDELESKLGKKLKTASGDGGDDDDRARDGDGDGGSVFKRRNDDDDDTRGRDDDEAREKRRRDEDEAREKKRRDDEEAAREKKRRDDEAAREKKRRDDDEARERKRKDDEARAKKRRGRDRDDDDGDGRRKRRTADRDSDVRERSDDDDDRPRRKRRKRGDGDGDEAERHVLTHAALWLDAGAAVSRRTLTYDGTGAMMPPPVGTAAPAGRLDAELYPAAFKSLRGAAAFGIAATYDRTFALGIRVPGTTVTAPITCGHYSIGARYRVVAGSAAFAFGVSYWRRYYIADRSQLMDPDDLDMPDVDYSAIAPSASGRFALTPKLAAFATFDAPLMLHSGPIQAGASYGAARILAFGLRTGVQIAIGEHYAAQLALELDQIGLKFSQKMGSLAAAREVQAATDRSLGFTATIGVMY